jgi:hypothetical protein
VPFNRCSGKQQRREENVSLHGIQLREPLTALLIASSAHHRLLFRKGLREQRLRMGNILAILGLAFLVPAMVGVIFVITDLIFGSAAALVVTVAMALLFSLLWFILPLPYRGNNED